MVELKHRRPSYSSPPAAGLPKSSQQSNTGCAFVIIGMIVVACIGLGKCSPAPSGNSENAASANANTAQEAISTAIAAQTSTPVEPMNKTSVHRGMKYLQLASKAEGLAGEMIYSQNCYDALSRHFTWAKLDVCGSFDIEAAQSLGDNEAAGFDKESSWFQSETAAGRYLKAATAAGEDADKADVRLSDLQSMVTHNHHGAPVAADAGAQTNSLEAPTDTTSTGPSVNAGAI